MAEADAAAAPQADPAVPDDYVTSVMRKRVHAHHAHLRYEIHHFEEGVAKGTMKRAPVGLLAAVHPRPPRVFVRSQDPAVIYAVAGKVPAATDLTRGRSIKDIDGLGQVEVLTYVNSLFTCN